MAREFNTTRQTVLRIRSSAR
ncbi:hypothetical protein [Yersinia thracica]